MSYLNAEHFHNESAAYEFVEARIWPNGPVCPHCGGTERNKKMGGASTRIGTYKCYDCRKPFTVKIGTIFESSHIKMHLWLQAIFLIASSKKGISSNQLHRTLGITLKSAWFMSHRIREAMKQGGLPPFGQDGGAVEADETYIGVNPLRKKKAREYGFHHKQKVFTLVDRDTKKARSFAMDSIKVATLLPLMQEHMSPSAHLMTDEARVYKDSIGKRFANHGMVQHQVQEYVSRTDPNVHTNTIEGFFSIFKRGMKGVYQHCSYSHLGRYLSEFDFRYNNRVAHGIDDSQRADILLRGVVGKRLTYKRATV